MFLLSFSSNIWRKKEESSQNEEEVADSSEEIQFVELKESGTPFIIQQHFYLLLNVLHQHIGHNAHHTSGTNSEGGC